MKQLKINLSLSGGGVKGIAHLGGIKALEDSNVEIAGISGSSAGAIIAALYGAGYSSKELKKIMYNQNLNDFKDNISVFRLVKKYGIYQGNKFLRWIKDKLNLKEIESFQDYKKDVKIVASDVNQKRIKVFSKAKTPNMSVAEAVRMSMGIPLFYIPYNYNNNLYVDGGVMNNLPLKVFNNSKLATLGFMLIEKESTGRKEVHNFFDYISSLMEMIIAVNEQRQIELSSSHIIAIETGKIKATNFTLTTEGKEWLYQSGYNKVQNNVDLFNDRRINKNFYNFESIREINPTTVELEEYVEEMIEYLGQRINLNDFNTIVTSPKDDYIFSYLIAQRLKKRFSIIRREEDEASYQYSLIKPGDKFIIIFFRDNQEELERIMRTLKDKKKPIAIITFLKEASPSFEFNNFLPSSQAVHLI